MRFINKFLIYLVGLGSALIFFYSIRISDTSYIFNVSGQNVNNELLYSKNVSSPLVYSNITNYYNIWCIFTKTDRNYRLKQKFDTFLTSLLRHSTVAIHLHIISDNSSFSKGENVIKNIISKQKKHILYTFYDVRDCAEKVTDIVKTMTPHFSSQPGSYYSGALFYLSLGLHRIAAADMDRAVIIDCDVKIVSDIKELFQEFDKFTPKTLFGLAPELSPVYRHVLYKYRTQFPETEFGNPYNHKYINNITTSQENSAINTNDINKLVKNKKNITVKLGFPGYNSGVVLLNLKNIRNDISYMDLLSPETVQYLVRKYDFKGHLADQDFYTILGFEYPELFRTLPCTWNRQLCTWWRDRGYADIFDYYYRCPGKIKLYHGNCNTDVANTSSQKS